MSKFPRKLFPGPPTNTNVLTIKAGTRWATSCSNTWRWQVIAINRLVCLEHFCANLCQRIKSDWIRATCCGRLRFSHEAICRCNVPRNFSLDLESRSDLSSMICWWFVICWGDMSPSVSRRVWCSLLPPHQHLNLWMIFEAHCIPVFSLFACIHP